MKPGILAESHRKQFEGQDYQGVAIDLATIHNIPYESEDYTLLLSSPDPGCDCGFCEKAKWED